LKDRVLKKQKIANAQFTVLWNTTTVIDGN
jgi:hypothetical protein